MFIVNYYNTVIVVLFCVTCGASLQCNNSYVEGKTRHSVEPDGKIPENLHILSRQKRQLLFPVATLLQISFLVATPVQLTKYTIFVNQGFQLNFQLPNRTSQLPASFLGVPPTIDVARSRTKRENSENSHTVRKFSTNYQPEVERDVFTSENMYFFMGKALESYGYKGVECVLHSICQLAKIPFHKEEDLLHEIVHFIMTPSEHDEANVTKADNDADRLFDNKYDRKLPQITHSFHDYLKAENAGKSQGNCDELYRFCPKSPLERFTEIEYGDDNDSDEK